MAEQLGLPLQSGVDKEFNHFRAICTTLRAIADELATRWPEAVELPYYPVFSRER